MITTGLVGRHGVEIVAVDASMNHLHGRHGLSFQYKRLPTEAVGTCSVTFSGVNAGSEIRVYLPGAVEAAGVENCAADHTLTWNAFSAGNPNNTVRIVIIHPDYKIKEFEYVSSVGSQSIPVQQERDKWYSNPV